MAMIRWSGRLLTGCLLLGAAAAFAQTNSTVLSILKYPTNPRHVVDYSTPTEAELPSCKADVISGATPNSKGYLLLDALKKPVRRFLDTNGDNQLDTFSYFKDGFEVYREIDGNHNKRIDEYRWYNAGGMKWGIDRDEDGVIESWKTISEEEAAQEAFHAVATGKIERLQALLLTETELASLGLPAAYVEKIRAKIKEAPAKFQEAVKKADVDQAKKNSARVESATPQCVPGESIGTTQDLYRYPSLSVLFETNAKTHEWLQTGEMVKVGSAWRLIDAPSIGNGPPPNGGGVTPPDDKSQAIMKEIATLDQANVQLIQTQGTGKNAQVAAYYVKRVQLIDQLLATSQLDAKNLELWQRQKGDNLQAAVLAGDASAMTSLRQFRDKTVADKATSPMAGYLTFRVLWSEYAPKLMETENLAKHQAEWMEKLASFVQSYPSAEDTPDALIQLAMGSEFGGKEDQAKRYYDELHKNFPQHHLGRKAEGAVRRLNLVGTKMNLTGNTLTNQQFNVASLQGKVVVVYYWASYCTTCATDFAKLNRMHGDFKAKGFEIVSVNLDDEAKQAADFLAKTPLTGTHLFAPSDSGGMNSPLAVQYGIMGLPTIFLVGKDGNVISRNIQINDLEDAVRKAQ